MTAAAANAAANANAVGDELVTGPHTFPEKAVCTPGIDKARTLTAMRQASDSKPDLSPGSADVGRGVATLPRVLYDEATIRPAPVETVKEAGPGKKNDFADAVKEIESIAGKIKDAKPAEKLKLHLSIVHLIIYAYGNFNGFDFSDEKLEQFTATILGAVKNPSNKAAVVHAIDVVRFDAMRNGLERAVSDWNATDLTRKSKDYDFMAIAKFHAAVNNAAHWVGLHDGETRDK